MCQKFCAGGKGMANDLAVFPLGNDGTILILGT